MDAQSVPFPPARLAYWRGLLVEHARALRHDIDALGDETVLQERSAPNLHRAESAAELQTADIDVSATVEEEQELRLVLSALDRIDGSAEPRFGVCVDTGRMIEPDRLELMPWTPFCAEASARRERLGLSADDARPDQG